MISEQRGSTDVLPSLGVRRRALCCCADHLTPQLAGTAPTDVGGCSLQELQPSLQYL